MQKFVRFVAGAGVVFALGALAVPGVASAASRGHDPWFGGSHVVFVQTDNVAGNQVLAYDRTPQGALVSAGAYSTGGLGGALNGSVVDHLASEGSLTYDQSSGLLIAVNAGSNTISVFSVQGDHLRLVQILSSGGTFPVSVATNGNVAYVLNAFDGGSVSGFWIGFGRLHPLAGSTRSLGLTIPTDATQFTHTPGQVAFSPDGSQLLVTTKATTSSIDVFSVGRFGLLSAAPVVNAEPGTVPFGISFDRAGDVAIANAGNDSLATFKLHWNGTLTQLDSVATGQAATCWVAPARGFLFASNAGGPSESGFATGPGGSLALLSTTTTDPGAVDAAATQDGRFLYVQTGLNGIIDGFSVNANGTLTSIGTTTVPGAVGGEGIVAL